ncbi:MAG: ATP-binding cassette domain-containing protein [Elusimicrobiota bacterium]
MSQTEIKVVLEFKDVKFLINGKVLFENVTLNLNEGELMTIVGTSGSGKSFLLKLCIGLLKPSAGEVKLWGESIGEYALAQKQKLRAKVGFVFQDAVLLNNQNVYNNLALPLRYHTQKSEKEIEVIVSEKLEHVNARAYIKEFPPALSHGVKKLVNIARALILDPKLLIYDEPTSGLDDIEAQPVLELIKKVNIPEDVTTLVVTSNSVVSEKLPGRVLLLKNKTVIDTGK